jgi:hypothetical protein
MPETNPARESDDLPAVMDLPIFLRDIHGNFSDELTVVTEDGRPLRITDIRYFYVDLYQHAEITVTEEVD